MVKIHVIRACNPNVHTIPSKISHLSTGFKFVDDVPEIPF